MDVVRRVLTLELLGETYTLNYNARAAVELELKAKASGYLSAEAYLGEDDPAKSIDNTLFVAALMIREGARYRQVIDGVRAPVVSADVLAAAINAEDMNRITQAVASEWVAASARLVSAQPPKKKEGSAAKA